ncbi:MAG TPA: acyl carrier protein [Ruminiclostridium sp.]|nr:acyl carrier protein [Ruminiclostridium sp.]
MQKQEIENKVCEVVSKVAQFNNDDVKADNDLRENYGVDSIVLVELLVELEDIFGITFDSSSLTYDTFSTVNSITEYVNTRING